MKDRGYGIPECVPAVRTPEPRDVPGAYFDPERVDRVIAGLKVLRHTQGRWAGRPLAPDAWQVAHFIAPVFGWVREIVSDDGDRVIARIIRKAYLDIPRKGGKTTLASGLALILAFADGEHSAQVLAVAASRDQAGNAYRPAKLIAEQSPELRAAKIRALRSHIESPDGSFFKAAASVGDLLHGANVHGAVVDELHVHKSPEVLDAVESGTGARSQPLVIIITTADAGDMTTVYARERGYVDQVAAGTISDPTIYGVVFAASKDDDPFIEATWRTANPGYGVSPTREFMTAEANKACQSPANLSRFLRLHLGLRTKQQARYLTMESWDVNASTVDELRLEGRDAYGGLDLAATSDLTALCWLFPDESGGYDALWRLWTPEANVDRLDRRTAGAASRWVRAGVLAITPGNVVDYGFIRAQIERDRDRFAVKTIGYDPWNASAITNDLVQDKAPMVKVRQGYITLSPPLKEVQRLLMSGTISRPLLRHGGNPAVRWMVDNLAVSMDPSGNVKPDKAKGSDKIDAVSALVTAMSEAMARPKQRSRKAVGV